jgi:hypothetical protein
MTPRSRTVSALAQPAPAPVVAAPEASADPSQQRGALDRSLNGHVFTPGLLIRSPFPVTSFEADLLYGSGTGTGPTYDVRTLTVAPVDATAYAALIRLQYLW